MSIARLLCISLLLCGAYAFAQNQSDTPTASIKPAPAIKHADSAQDTVDHISSAPSRLNENQSSEFPKLKVQVNTALSNLPGDNFCLNIRSYLVERDSKYSDTTHLVGYSTCQPAQRFQLKTTELRFTEKQESDPENR